MEKKKSACGVRTGAKQNKLKKYESIENSIECLLEGRGEGPFQRRRERTKEKKTLNKSLNLLKVLIILVTCFNLCGFRSRHSRTSSSVD